MTASSTTIASEPSRLGAATRVAVTAALLVGVPIALWLAVGWPLPTGLPSADELRRAWVQQDIPEATLTKALAIVVWVAWAQLAWVVVTEAIAVVRGRATRTHRTLPGIGHLGRQAVASLVLLVSTLGPSRAALGQPVRPLVAIETAFDTSAGAPDIRSTAPSASAPVTEVVHEVGRGESLWRLAERYYGDGMRWREIRDHNVGRAVAPGRVLSPVDDHLDVGWRLAIPGTEAEPAGGPPPAAPSTPSSPSAPPTEVTVQLGESLWDIAEAHVEAEVGREPTVDEVTDQWEAVVEANRPRLVDRLDPSLLHPGQRIVLPALPGSPRPTPEPEPAPAPAPERSDAGAAPTAPVAPPSEAEPDEVPPESTTTPTTASAQPEPAPEDATSGDEEDAARAEPAADAPPPASVRNDDSADEGSPAWAVGLTGLAGTALAVGVTEAVRRRRRRRALLDPDSLDLVDDGDPVHRDLLVRADADALALVRHHLVALARRAAAGGQTFAPWIVQLGPDHLDVLLSVPTSPPLAGWHEQAGGTIWSCPVDDSPPDDPNDSAVPPTPLLVTLGAPDNGGQLYVDVETARVVALTGDRETAAGVARAMVTELAHSPLAETAQVLVVGDLGVASIARLDHVTVVPDWAVALADLRTWAKGTTDALVDRGWPNPFVGRGHGEFEDALTPLLVVAEHAPAPDDLADVTSGPSSTGVLVITDDPPPGATIADCHPDRLTLPQLGLDVRPQMLSRDDLESIVDILGDAGGWDDAELAALLDDQPHDDEPADLLTGPPPTTDDEPGAEAAGQPPATAPAVVAVTPAVVQPSAAELQRATDAAEPESSITVRLLGDITIDGTAEPLSRAQSAVIAYLALHSPASNDRMEEALWPNVTPQTARRRLIGTMSECRTLLGHELLPPQQDGRYTIGADVTTDLASFEQQVAAADDEATRTAADRLASALALVRGPVFAYPRRYGTFYTWVDLENWATTWELKVATAAQRLTTLLLDLDDPIAAIETAEKALLVIPTHAGCTEGLMRAHAAHGDRTAVRRVYAAHAAALDRLGLDAPAEATTELFERLRRG